MCGIRTIGGEEEGEEEEQEVTCALQYRIIEESMLVFAVPMAWFYLMFFAGYQSSLYSIKKLKSGI